MEDVPKKGEYVINPNSGRPVKVGSRIWTKLVKDGIIENTYIDDNEIEELPEEDVDEKIQEINQKLPRGTHAVRGRGKYKGKIVKRNKQPLLQETIEHAARTSARVLAENADELDDLDDDDMQNQLEQLILEEMMLGVPKQVRKQIPRARSNTKYVSQPIPEYNEEEEEETDSE